MQAWERRSFWEPGQIWSKARHGRVGIEHSTTLETKGLMPIRWARILIYLGKRSKDLKSGASEHVFHSFVHGANNVIQWTPDAIFALSPGADSCALAITRYIVLPTRRDGKRRETQQPLGGD